MRAMPARLRQATQWIALLVPLALGGCSTIKFAYNNVDWLLLDKADYYLDLDDAQQEHARQLLAARMEAHRREELPIYVTNLIQIRTMLADNLTPAEVESIKQQIQGLYRRTMGGTIPGIVGVYVTGLILELTGSWALVFQVTAAVTAFGMVFYLLFASGERQFD